MPSWNEKNHVRQNSRCRLHGLEQRYPPPAQGGERVSRTTENLVKIQCGGVAVGDTATWHRLIEKFVPVETTWLSRPLLLQKGEGGGEDDTFFDVSLGRNYTSAEGDQVARELREAREMDSLQTKARAVLELYRRRGRHPRKLIMNLAYDPFSAEPLWEEALARWGEQAVEPQGPHSHQTALAYWNEAGDIKAVTPPLPSSPRTDGGASSHSTSDEENNNTNVDTTAGDVNLGARAPVTPEWPRRRRNAASSSRIWGNMAADPHVYRGRWKPAWKVKSKIQWRADRQRRRQHAARERQQRGPQ